MQSNNPVFNRAEGFNGRGAATTRSNDPSQWKIDLDGSASHPGLTPTTGRGTGLMTIESSVEKTAISLAVVVAVAAVTWFMTPDLSVDSAGFATIGMLAMVGAVAGFALSMVNSFKKVVSPALVLAFAAAEGVFVGALSKIIAAYVGDPTIVFQAVLATMVAFGATLGAYKFFNIQVTDKFRKVVTISMFAFVGVMLVNFVLSITGVLESGGLRGFNTLGLVVSAIAVVLGVFMLIMDFDFVERGVEAGLPERESWRAAFGLTVTLVWLYIEILRILAILRGQD
jgi:uncharacterized YccA/Bax inhibitor family protein